MTEDILQTYCDEEENMIFQNQFLEEVTQEQSAIVGKRDLEDPLMKEKCSICEYLQKGVRYHPEDACWFKTKMNIGREKINKQIKHINNSELECELQNEDQKN
ncbi:hypothetical protein RR48_00836 [Papilio machaon]|uniref:Uncharacterized protein n=1 Tax=Papilio machaon TaxID=76193 RepID=A0A0N0PFS1_PAPMA|nr:hypothetical protein RR48_00836 [Papilio machaon]